MNWINWVVNCNTFTMKDAYRKRGLLKKWKRSIFKQWRAELTAEVIISNHFHGWCCVITDVLAVVKIMGCTGSGLFVHSDELCWDPYKRFYRHALLGLYQFCCISLNHSERLFDRQMYLLSKSMTSEALIIMMSADK